MQAKEFQHVDYLWDDTEVGGMSPVERLVYRSNILGADQRITNTGGGNTSSKILEEDPLTGEQTDVLWVKGSGGDLRTSKKENFASLYMDKLYALQPIYDRSPVKGVKTPIEDAMVGMYRHCTFDLNARASSIDTPLHAFVPYRHIDHMHPNAVIAIAAAKNSEALTREIYGDEIVWLPWQRPGFDLGLALQRVCKEHPNCRGVILGQHGIINWADDDKECYELTLDLIERAALYIEERDLGEDTFGGSKYDDLSEDARKRLLIQLLPWLRGKIGPDKRLIGTVQSDERVLKFVNSNDAMRLADLGTSCPDHFLRTKIKPLMVDWKPSEDGLDELKQLLEKGIDQYRVDYQSYYEDSRRDDSPAMRNPNPTVVLIPGLGMTSWGKNKSESRVTGEFYKCAVEVMCGAEAVDSYIQLPRQEAFDIEYWALEEAKLRRMPPEKEWERKVAVVVGAGSGIGREAATTLAYQGAHVVCADLTRETADATASAIEERLGQGIGVAGSGISACGPAIAVQADVTKRESVRRAFDDAVLAYGGVDEVVVTAGIFVPPDRDGRISDEAWDKTYRINVTGVYIVAEEAAAVWRAQNLSGEMVVTTSVNAMVCKRGSFAYDTSKAAANHLVRELALELAPGVRVNAVAPATVVSGSSMFPRDRVISSLLKYDIAFDETDSTEILRNKLSAFYAARTLTGKAVRPEDQVDAILFLLSRNSERITGHVVPVDGGLHEAFLR